MSNIDITGLLDFGADSRKLRTYAYLTASLQDQSTKTTDTIDCLIPFLAAGVAAQASQFLDLSQLSAFLTGIGLTIPIYVLQQLVPRLEALGLVEWHNSAKRHLCKTAPIAQVQTRSNSSDLGAAFEVFEQEVTTFAAGLGLNRPPLAPTWSDAFIAFLKTDVAKSTLKATKVKNVLVGDPAGLEAYIVARFIQEAQIHNKDVFDVVVRIFTGVLIEDFITNIQTVGDPAKYQMLNIYYDTSVILRLLGGSGPLFKSATVEMHRSLQDLGCKCLYLERTEEEVARILDTILGTHDAGGKLFGETAEAILNGEITIAALRDLQATFPERLAESNVFPATYNYTAHKGDDVHQIDERGLGRALVAEASKRDRSYKEPNALNDARAVAIVLRMRKGVAKRDLNACGHVFVTRNTVLQVATRRFVSQHVEGYEGRTIPPVLTVGQITTAAWLATAKTLEPQRVTKELLATCYNAVRPSPDWTVEFSRALETFRDENPGFIEARANAALFLTTARNYARDDSLNQPAVLRQANIVDLFLKVGAESDQKQREQNERLEREKDELRKQVGSEARARQAEAARAEREREDLMLRMAEEAKQEAAAARREAEESARYAALCAAERTRAEMEEQGRAARQSLAERHANTAARFVRISIQLALAIPLAALAILYGFDYWQGETGTKTAVNVLLGLVLLLSVLDLTGWEIVSKRFALAERALARALMHPVGRLLGDNQPFPRVRLEPQVGRSAELMQKSDSQPPDAPTP